MHYIIFDTEFITSFNKSDKRPADLVNIGAICLDKKGDIVDEFEVYIKPLIRKKINSRFTKLTGISEETLASGDDLGLSLRRFNDWIRKFKPHILCCWSTSDILMFHESCKIVKFQRLVNRSSYFDIQKSYMDLFRLKQNPSLKSCLIENEIVSEDDIQSIHFHNAMTDSIYTTKLFLMYFSDFKIDINSNYSGARFHNAFDLNSIR